MARATIKRNKDVRSAAKDKSVFLWEIAEKLDVSERSIANTMFAQFAQKADTMSANRGKQAYAPQGIERQRKDERVCGY